MAIDKALLSVTNTLANFSRYFVRKSGYKY